jgi:hypothetical protein
MPDEHDDGWSPPVDQEKVEQMTDMAADMLIDASRPLVKKALRRLFTWRERVGKRVENYVREAWSDE